MTTTLWVTLIFGILGVVGAFAAWIIVTFQTKDSAALQEKAINAIVESGVDRIKGETSILRSIIEPLREDIRDLKKKFDAHMDFHAGSH